MKIDQMRVVNILLSQIQLQIDLQILQMEVQYKHSEDEMALLSLDLLKMRRDKIIEMGQEPRETTTATWRHPDTGKVETLR